MSMCVMLLLYACCVWTMELNKNDFMSLDVWCHCRLPSLTSHEWGTCSNPYYNNYMCHEMLSFFCVLLLIIGGLQGWIPRTRLAMTSYEVWLERPWPLGRHSICSQWPWCPCRRRRRRYCPCALFRDFLADSDQNKRSHGWNNRHSWYLWNWYKCIVANKW